MSAFNRPPSIPDNKLKPFKGTLRTGEKIRNINGKSFVVPAEIKKPDGSPTINASNTFQAANVPVGSAELVDKIRTFDLDSGREILSTGDIVELAEKSIAQVITENKITIYFNENGLVESWIVEKSTPQTN